MSRRTNNNIDTMIINDNRVYDLIRCVVILRNDNALMVKMTLPRNDDDQQEVDKTNVDASNVDFDENVPRVSDSVY